MSEEEFSPKQINDLCKSLARKYKSRNNYEDLISEGVIACYEALSQGQQSRESLMGVARRAMHDYTNIKTKVVNVPVSGASRRASKLVSGGSLPEGVDGVSAGTLTALLAALSPTIESVPEDYPCTRDHALEYEAREYYTHVLTVAVMSLTREEWAVFKMRYLDEMTQDVVADALGVSQTWVFRHEKSSLDRLRHKLCNNS